MDWNKMPTIVDTISRYVRDQAVHEVCTSIIRDRETFDRCDLHDAAQIAAATALDQFAVIIKREIALIEAEHERRGREMMTRPLSQIITDAQRRD